MRVSQVNHVTNGADSIRVTCIQYCRPVVNRYTRTRLGTFDVEHEEAKNSSGWAGMSCVG